MRVLELSSEFAYRLPEKSTIVVASLAYKRYLPKKKKGHAPSVDAGASCHSRSSMSSLTQEHGISSMISLTLELRSSSTLHTTRSSFA
jgi:hypothetical protein